MRNRARDLFLLAAAIAVCAGVVALEAQQAAPTSSAPAIKRTVLTRQDTTIPGKEAIMVVVDFPPGSSEGRHTHPTAEVYAFVAEGTIQLEAQGKPNATLKTGDSFTIAPGQVHEGTNNSGAPAKLYVVFIADKGKPLTAPAQ